MLILIPSISKFREVIMSDNQTQKTIAVWQPFFLGGGAEAVALWILEALKEDFEVTLHTFCDIDLRALDRMYGTNLAASTIKVNSVTSGILTGFLSFVMSNNSFLRTAFVYKTIKNLKDNAEKYDVVFSAFNNIDMGRKGIQYFHWTHVVERPYETAKWWQVMLMRWAQFSHQSMRQNLSLANSQYTATVVKKTYDVATQIVYPPVVANIEPIAWEDKEDAFICSGRLVIAKQPHRIINIVKSIRDRGFDVKLHITGAGGGSEQKYLRKVRSLAKRYSEWVYLHEDMPYADYLNLMSRCKYGVHYKPEPFGISVAEMLKAGVIPFVRSKGGQIEIVGAENKELLFDGEEQATEKIVNVLTNLELRQKLRQTLEERACLFKTDLFINEIQKCVEQYVESGDFYDSADM